MEREKVVGESTWRLMWSSLIALSMLLECMNQNERSYSFSFRNSPFYFGMAPTVLKVPPLSLNPGPWHFPLKGPGRWHLPTSSWEVRGLDHQTCSASSRTISETFTVLVTLNSSKSLTLSPDEPPDVIGQGCVWMFHWTNGLQAALLLGSGAHHLEPTVKKLILSLQFGIL